MIRLINNVAVSMRGVTDVLHVQDLDVYVYFLISKVARSGCSYSAVSGKKWYFPTFLARHYDTFVEVHKFNIRVDSMVNCTTW
jgi:hypothetical protein